MKNIKLYIILFVLISISAFYYFISNKEVTFLYLNPYTETKGFRDIAVTIKTLDKALDFTQNISERDGYPFKYIFKNAYGSGFLKNNPIPNDLDFAVGVYLGEYVYDGSNADEIANSIVDKMDSFQYLFNSYINTLNDGSLYIDKTIFQVLNDTASVHRRNAKVISSSIPTVFAGRDYIRYTQKTMDGTPDGEKVELPYILKSNEILIEEYPPINLFSDSILYNSNMPRYMRTISIIPEFFVKIKSNDKNVTVEVVPEAFLGERLQLSRRFFASTVFVGINSAGYLNNLSYIKEDEDYLYYRMFSYRRHLQEISNLKLIKDRPVKMLKRIMQTADIISPVIDKQDYREIADIVNQNLSDRDIQLLNEYSNICVNIYLIQESPQLFLRLLEEQKIRVMYDTMTKCLDELEMRAEISEGMIDNLRKFQVAQLQKMFLLQNSSEVIAFRDLLLAKNLDNIQRIINKTIFEKLHDKDKLNSYIDLFNKIYTDAGYHKVTLYWLDRNTMGVLNDSFTKNIKDFKQFAAENNLADTEYKLLKPGENPKTAVKYTVWARYNSSYEEDINYQKLRKALLDDKKNFKLKRKFVIIP